MSELLKIGGLWKNKDKNGNDYFSGTFTYGTKMMIMSNTFKEKENDPDFMVYLTKKEQAPKDE
tara:strand:+ start:425 stop:613 length:189 start_codon:yes stop_codon:yes gene_type:complete